jgi:hypothetical protein
MGSKASLGRLLELGSRALWENVSLISTKLTLNGRHLLEKSLLALPMSWDGDPLPDLGALPILFACMTPLVMPNDDRPADGRESIGELLAEGEFERG